MLSHSFSRRSPGSMLNPMIILPQKIDVLKRSFLFLMNRILRFFYFLHSYKKEVIDGYICSNSRICC